MNEKTKKLSKESIGSFGDTGLKNFKKNEWLQSKATEMIKGEMGKGQVLDFFVNNGLSDSDAEKFYSDLKDELMFEKIKTTIKECIELGMFEEAKSLLFEVSSKKDKINARMDELYAMKKNELLELYKKHNRTTDADIKTAKDILVSGILEAEFGKRALDKFAEMAVPAETLRQNQINHNKSDLTKIVESFEEEIDDRLMKGIYNSAFDKKEQKTIIDFALVIGQTLGEYGFYHIMLDGQSHAQAIKSGIEQALQEKYTQAGYEDVSIEIVRGLREKNKFFLKFFAKF